MASNMTLQKLVLDRFGVVARDHLSGLPGQDRDNIRSGVEHSITAVLDGFSSLAEDGSGRQLLYDAVRYCDESVVDNPAEMFEERDSRDVFNTQTNKLTGLVGAARKQKMVDDLKVASNLQDTDADNLLGYVTPGVLGVLKRQIENGTVLDNPDGIGQLFLGEGDINNVPAAQRTSGHNAGQFQTTGYGAATMSEGSDGSWFFRYALPVVLVGGLVLAGLNNCGNMAGKKVVAQQESKLQAQLDGVKLEFDTAKGQISALKGEYDVANSLAAELGAKADGLGIELEAAKASIIGLEADVATARSESQAARTEADSQIASLQSEYDAAQTQVSELTAASDGYSAELETAKANIGRLESELATATSEAQAASAAAEEQIATLQADYDAEQARASELAATADGLNAELETAKASIAGLESDIESTRTAAQSARSTAQGQLSSLQGEYDAAKAQGLVLAEKTEALNAELGIAKANIATLEAEVEAANSRLSVEKAQSTLLDGRVQQITAELAAVKDLPTEASQLQGLLASVSSERDTSMSAVSTLQSQLDAALAEKQAALDVGIRLRSELDEAVAVIDANQQTLADFDDTKAALEEMKLGRDEAIARNVEFKTTNAELQAQFEITSAEVAKQQQQLSSAASLRATLEQKIAETTQALDQEQSGREVDVNRLSANSANLKNQLSSILGMRDQALDTLKLRDGEISDLGDKVVTLEGQLATLEDANAAARAEAAELESKIQALNGELQTTNVSVDEARASLAATEETLVSANGDLEVARLEIEALVTERDELQLKRDALTSRIEELMAEKDTVVAETVGLNEQIIGLTTDLKSVRAAGVESESKLSLLKESFSGLQQELGVVTGARDQVSGQAEELRTEVAGLTEEVARLDGELVQAKESHETALSAMQSEKEQVQAELDDVRSSLTSELSNVQSSLGAQIGSLEKQRDAALEKIEQANADLAALNEEKASAQAMIDDMKLQSASLQDALKKEESSVSGLQETVSTLEAARMSLTAARDESGQKIAELNAEIASLSDTVQKEQGTVSQLTASVAELESVRDALTAERDEARGVIEMTEARLAQSGQEISTLMLARDGLQSNIDQAAAMAQAKINETLAVQYSIDEKLRAAGVDSASVDAVEDNSAVAIVLGSGDLYGVGSAELSRKGSGILGTVGAIVSEFPEWHIDVEGHTDSQGIGAALRKKYPTNWELSSARAASAVRYLNSRAGIDSEKMSARGYGQTRPLDTNETAAGREKNRRVEIILRR